MDEILDRQVWNMLTGRLAHLAQGGDARSVSIPIMARLPSCATGVMKPMRNCLVCYVVRTMNSGSWKPE